MTTSADGESGVEGFLQAGRGGHHHRADSPADTDQVHGERNGNQHRQHHNNLVRGVGRRTRYRPAVTA